MTPSGKFPYCVCCRMLANFVWVMHRRDRDLKLQASLIPLPGSPYEKERRPPEEKNPGAEQSAVKEVLRQQLKRETMQEKTHFTISS